MRDGTSGESSMDTQWHYADRQHQQRGPVAVEWLQAAYARAEVDGATLVWREGLAQWVMLAQVAGELGIVSAPGVARAAATAAPSASPRVAAVVKPGRGLPAWAILLIVLGAMLPVLGIVAAIAIPAYNDYRVRSRVAEGLAIAQPLRIVVLETWDNELRCPGNEDAGVGAPGSYARGALQSIELGENDEGACMIELRFLDLGTGHPTDVLQMVKYRDWHFRSTIEPRYLPATIRGRVESI